MESKLKLRKRTEFFSLVDEFIENIMELFPDCGDTKDMQTIFRGTTRGSKMLENEFLQSWYDNMCTPLAAKHVKYARALERIMGTPGTVYHACVYHDADAMHLSCDSATLSKIGLYDKFHDDRMKDHKDTVWKYIEELNRVAYSVLDKETPRVPTREEINENIAQSKKKSAMPAEQPSMISAFATNLDELCVACNKKDVLNTKTEQSRKELMQRWARATRVEIEGERVAALCEKGDSRAVAAYALEFPELCLSDVSSVPWSIIKQLNAFSAVGDNIPPKMMGRIEDLANKLADDLASGRKDLSNLSLADIGQQVLSGCDTTDMNQFADNIGELMPALQGFQRQMSK